MSVFTDRNLLVRSARVIVLNLSGRLHATSMNSMTYTRFRSFQFQVFFKIVYSILFFHQTLLVTIIFLQDLHEFKSLHIPTLFYYLEFYLSIKPTVCFYLINFTVSCAFYVNHRHILFIIYYTIFSIII